MKKLLIGISAEGSIILLKGQLRYFKSLGYDTYLMGPWSQRLQEFCDREGCTHLNIEIEREISVFKDLRSLLQIIGIFRKIKPDIINLGTPKVSLLGMIAGRILGIKKRIYTCRGFRFESESGFKAKLLMQLEKVTGHFADQVIFISESLRQTGVQLRLFDPDKSVVINKGSSNGIDLKLYNKANIEPKELEEERLRWELKGKVVYGYIGRLVNDKGIRELLEAFEILYGKHQDVVLMMVGSNISSSPADKEFLRKYASHPGIRWTGYINNVPLYLSLFDVFVMATYREGFGNVYIQAAALGVAVIGTDVTGAKNALQNNFNGILVQPKNSEDLFDKMELLYLDDERRRKFAANGLQWASHFDSEIIWEGLDKLYRD